MKICYRGQQVFLKSAESQRKNKTAKRRSKFSQGTRYLPLTKNTAAISHRCLYYFYSVILNLQINTSHRLGCYNYSLLQHNSLISFCIANFLSNYVINIFFSFRFRFLQQCILRYLHPFHNNHKSTHFSLILQISL